MKQNATLLHFVFYLCNSVAFDANLNIKILSFFIKKQIMTKNYLLLGLVLMTGLFYTSCNPDEDIDDPEEVITTLNYVLTPSSGGDAVTLSFRDIDGDGGDDPVITGGTLGMNETYTGIITLSNESETPAEDITAEVREEGEEHQFFFSTDITDLAVAYADQDETGNPLGLTTTVTTGAAGSGNLTVILRHEPMKNATGVSDGDITNAEGETDIEVTFTVDVQ